MDFLHRDNSVLLYISLVLFHPRSPNSSHHAGNSNFLRITIVVPELNRPQRSSPPKNPYLNLKRNLFKCSDLLWRLGGCSPIKLYPKLSETTKRTSSILTPSIPSYTNQLSDFQSDCSYQTRPKPPPRKRNENQTHKDKTLSVYSM
jgi:hypothetical protein